MRAKLAALLCLCLLISCGPPAMAQTYLEEALYDMFKGTYLAEVESGALTGALPPTLSETEQAGLGMASVASAQFTQTPERYAGALTSVALVMDGYTSALPVNDDGLDRVVQALITQLRSLSGQTGLALLREELLPTGNADDYMIRYDAASTYVIDGERKALLTPVIYPGDALDDSVADDAVFLLLIMIEPSWSCAYLCADAELSAQLFTSMDALLPETTDPVVDHWLDSRGVVRIRRPAEAVFATADDAQAQAGERETLDSARLAESGRTLTYPVRDEAPDKLFSSLLLSGTGIRLNTDPANAANAVSALVGEIFNDADQLRQSLNLPLVDTESALTMASIYAPVSWMSTMQTEDGATRMLIPFCVRDTDGMILQGAFYVLLCTWTDLQGEAWLCAEDDLTYRMLRMLNPRAEGNEEENAAVSAWMNAYEELRASIISSGAEDYAGSVTITSSGWVNIRADGTVDSDIIGRARPGEVYLTYGTNENGWYAILLEDGQLGYISPRMVEFMPK